MPALHAVAARPAVGPRPLVDRPRPLFSAAAVAAFVGYRNKDAILERCQSLSQKWSAYKPLANRGVVACTSKGMSFPCLSSTSSPFLGRDQGALLRKIPLLPKRSNSIMPVQASKDSPFKCRIPKIDEKPEWWCRILACLPYLLALMMSETAFYLQPFLERYEFLENLFYYIPGAVKRLPWWFQFIHFYFAYLGVVQNDKWPPYLRFHVAMGFLLESALLVVVHSSNFLPLIHFQGTFGLYYWAAVGFLYILMNMECVRCALAGSYARLPLISDNAFIHILFRMRGYHRPF